MNVEFRHGSVFIVEFVNSSTQCGWLISRKKLVTCFFKRWKEKKYHLKDFWLEANVYRKTDVVTFSYSLFSNVNLSFQVIDRSTLALSQIICIITKQRIVAKNAQVA